MQKDALIVPLSDFHSGSNHALFVNRFWTGKEGSNHTPNGKQELIRGQWERLKTAVKAERKGKRLIVVVNGDAIEGVHHNSIDVCTHDLADQADIHIELIDEFRKAVNWQRGDLLYYVLGTETHTLNIEYDIAEQAGAEQMRDGAYASNHLALNVNGRELWFAHHGASAGKGANEGNALRNRLRDIYWDAVKDKIVPPDVVYSGHFHRPTCNVYLANEEMTFRAVWGVILPSFQAKTRFAYKVAPVERNKVGGTTQTITADGDIRPPSFYTCDTEAITRA